MLCLIDQGSLPAAKDHPAGIKNVIPELAVGCEAIVIPILNVGSSHLVAAFIRVLALPARRP